MSFQCTRGFDRRSYACFWIYDIIHDTYLNLNIFMYRLYSLHCWSIRTSYTCSITVFVLANEQHYPANQLIDSKYVPNKTYWLMFCVCQLVMRAHFVNPHVCLKMLATANMIGFLGKKTGQTLLTLPKFNIAPEKLPSQWESSLPTTNFQGLC